MSQIYFEIQANDPEKAITFYGTLFKWSFHKVEGLPIPYWQIRIDDDNHNAGGLLQRPALTPPQECGTNAFVCSLEVKDFDAIAEQVEALGGAIALPKFAVPGVCWQGYFIDPDNNTFGIFQPDDSS